MFYRITAFVFSVLLVTAVAILGLAIFRDFMIWHDQEWGTARIIEIKQSKIRRVVKQSGLSGRSYVLEFGGKRKSMMIVESIDFRQGDSIRVVYSPMSPKAYRLKIPSIAWIAGWAILYILFMPLVLYYGLQVLWGYLRGKF